MATGTMTARAAQLASAWSASGADLCVVLSGGEAGCRVYGRERLAAALGELRAEVLDCDDPQYRLLGAEIEPVLEAVKRRFPVLVRV
jgi:hypothetical protein